MSNTTVYAKSPFLDIKQLVPKFAALGLRTILDNSETRLDVALAIDRLARSIDAEYQVKDASRSCRKDLFWFALEVAVGHVLAFDSVHRHLFEDYAQHGMMAPKTFYTRVQAVGLQNLLSDEESKQERDSY